MIKGRKFFITGGAGFIGSNLINRIFQENYVIVYDNFSRDSIRGTGLLERKNIEIFRGDILDYDSVKKCIPSDVDIVIHLAAIAGIDTVIKNPAKTIEVNVIGTYNLLKSLMELKVIDRIEFFINFSTSEVFGISAFRVDEKTPANLQPVGEARWTYSVAKLVGEHLVYAYYNQYGLKAVNIRPFNIYGPGQVGEGAIHHFVVRALKNEPLIIHGDGSQIRSWCYIDDLVDAVILCLENQNSIGESFNIGNPKGTITILSLAEKIIHLAGSSSQIVYVPKNYADVELRIPSIDKAKQILGFEPKVDLNEGIRRTIQWYREKIKRENI
ncbi:MAG: GDP-mannose 4,6-dehydratase [bacterium]|nr:GDP-mannose 4,6-dehydratase [bacterium]